MLGPGPKRLQGQARRVGGDADLGEPARREALAREGGVEPEQPRDRRGRVAAHVRVGGSVGERISGRVDGRQRQDIGSRGERRRRDPGDRVPSSGEAPRPGVDRVDALRPRPLHVQRHPGRLAEVEPDRRVLARAVAVRAQRRQQRPVAAERGRAVRDPQAAERGRPGVEPEVGGGGDPAAGDELGPVVAVGNSGTGERPVPGDVDVAPERGPVDPPQRLVPDGREPDADPSRLVGMGRDREHADVRGEGRRRQLERGRASRGREGEPGQEDGDHPHPETLA